MKVNVSFEMLEQPTIKLLWSGLSSVEGENDLRSFERKAMILPQRERDFVVLYFVAVYDGHKNEEIVIRLPVRGDSMFIEINRS